jgi:hypothetical protein
MNAARISRLGHRWLALAVGLQLAVWTLSGLYMVVVDLDFIHGDSLVRNLSPALARDRAMAPLAPIIAGRSDVTGVELRVLPDQDQAVYEVRGGSRRELYDAASGHAVPQLDEHRARTLATAYYAGAGSIARVTFIGQEHEVPREIRGRNAPLWRVDFDDALATTLYVDPQSGRLVSRRHRFWRWFDFLWSLHIMDYGERENIDNALLRVATPVAVTTATFGLWVAFFSFSFLQRRRTRSRDTT